MDELLARQLAGLRTYLEHRRQHQGELSGLSTGFPTLDLKLGGLQPGEIIILGGRPGQGKTALASQIAFHAAEKLYDQDEPGIVLFLSAEMAPQAILQREIARRTGVSLLRQNQGEYDVLESLQIQTLLDTLVNLPLRIHHGGFTLDLIQQWIEQAHPLGVKLVVLDYLQLIDTPNYQNRNAGLTDATNRLMRIRDKLKAPMLVLSQLRRPEDGKELQRPHMTQLRDSGSIEASANQVWLIYNPAVLPVGDTTEVRPELIVEKNRNGWVGIIPLEFHGERVAFFDTLAASNRAPTRPVEESLPRYHEPASLSPDAQDDHLHASND